jgi:hydroxymethylglutaryl-CoA reductase
MTSRLSGFHKLELATRLRDLSLSNKSTSVLQSTSEHFGELADDMVENAIGTMPIPLGLATNVRVDGEDVLVPMATEESSVVAAVCNSAKQCYETGGVKSLATEPLMIAQIQVLDLDEPFAAKDKVLARKVEIKTFCDGLDPVLLSLGGGLNDVECRVIDTGRGAMLIVHIIVNVLDAMGANAVNTMAEALAPKIAEWTGGRTLLRILSNLADKRLVKATVQFSAETIGGTNVREAILDAAEFAWSDPYRAATHNKGIMNGISAVALATGNDTRALESGAHAYAARDGQYRGLSRWHADDGGNLVGDLELPMAVGIVGGATKAHPVAQANLEIMKIKSADRLARVIVAVGLLQNFGALKALATVGIQKGHMALHARNVAIAAGAEGPEIDIIATVIVGQGKVRQDVAEAVLEKIRGV